MNKLLVIFLILTAGTVWAQGYGSVGLGDPRAAGMANSYMSSSRGVYALGKNPANIAIPMNNKFEISTVIPIPNVNISVGNDFISIKDYKEFFLGEINDEGKTVGRYLDEEGKNEFMDLFSKGTSFRTSVTANVFSITYNHDSTWGAFGFSVNDKFTAAAGLPSAVFDLALGGNVLDSLYKFDDMDMRSTYVRDFSISYARETEWLQAFFDKLYIGASIKFVQGYFYMGLDEVGTSILTNSETNSFEIRNQLLMNVAASPDYGIEYDFEDTTKQSNFGLFPEAAGSGIGFDFGFTGEINDFWTFSMSWTDLGSITWDKDPVQYSADTLFILDDLSNSELLDSLGGSLELNGKYGSSFTTDLPSAFRMGSLFNIDKAFDSFPGSMILVVDWNFGLNELPSNSQVGRFSIGTEYKPIPLLPIRTGFSWGGRYGFSWSMGMGVDLDVFDFSLAAYNLNTFTSETGKSFGFSMGTRFRF